MRVHCAGVKLLSGKKSFSPNPPTGATSAEVQEFHRKRAAAVEKGEDHTTRGQGHGALTDLRAVAGGRSGKISPLVGVNMPWGGGGLDMANVEYRREKDHFNKRAPIF